MRRAVLVGAAVALVATVVVAVPAWAQNQEVAPTPAAVGADPPAKPHNLGASAEHDEVTLTWTASTDQTVTHYAILRRNRDADAVGVFHVIEANAGPETSYTDSSVTASSTYVYRAKAISPTGVSQWSGYVRADTPPAPPEPATADQEDQTANQEDQKEGASEFVQVVPRLAVFTDADSVVPLNWALTPSGLSAGNQFRLLFVTHPGHAPTSTDIDDYNDYVQSQANASNAHSAIKPYASGFRVVGSTDDDDARDNTSTAWTNINRGVPIYWLNGSKVADDYEDFHDGSWDDEANPRGRNGNRVGSHNTWIWTGSNSNGTEAITDNNSQALGASTVALGCLTGAGGPIDCEANTVGTYAFSTPHSNFRYYALSEVFTVGGSSPVFTDSDPASRSVAENSRAFTNVGALVAATDADIGDTLTYSLGGTDAASFNIGTTSGRILTKAGVSYDHETKSRYFVEVTVTDGTYSATIAVTITVTDVDEPQSAAPGAPTVSATGSTSHLKVTWTAPANTSHPINDYDMQYRTDGSGAWIEWPHNGTGLSTTIAGLTAGTAFEVQVRARNIEGVTAWSGSGRATTATATAVALNWELKPSGVAAGGQFRLLFVTHRTLRPNSSDIGDYNSEAQGNARAGHRAIKPYASGFTVVGSTDDDDARDNTATTYTNTAKGLPIYWLNGSKVADDYEDFYDGTWDDEANSRNRGGNLSFPANGEVWTGSNSNGTAATAALGDSSVRFGRLNGTGDPLNANGTYTDTRQLPYYALSEVFTVGSAANSAPVFADTAPAARSVAENPGAGANVGAPVAASDADADDTVRYSLRGADARSFAIDQSSGQIRTKSGVAYDFESKSGYSVQVRATDGTHTVTNTADIAVTITITDVAEPPRAPAAPRVRTVAANTDKLAVHWTAPANSGPPVTDYDVRYRLGGSGAWNDVSHTGTARTAAITGLSAANIDDVAVQVRATNDEGTGAYSKSSPALYDICGRTAQVVQAILAATPGADSCDSVSWQDMAAITALDARVTKSRSLKWVDLDGLAGLTHLDLSDTSLDSLPPGIFANLGSLTELDLSDNHLLMSSDWHAGIFDGLDSLETLRLANVGYEGRGIQFINNNHYNGFFEGLGNLRELDVGPSTPHLGAPLAFVPLTSLVTYNGQPYTRPVAAPQNLTAAISDIAGSVIVRVRDDRGRLTGEKASFCKKVTLNWQPPAGAANITGYKIMRTHYGHPVISQRKPNTDYRRYGYDIATLAAGDRSYVHEPLRPGANGHTFTYYVAAVTPDGVGFPAVVNVSAPIKIRWNSTGTMTTGPDALPCPMLE
ncbi:fibronectin type III domain-containing protein [Candidatus Poriferisodalis sp.]|uniref:fibronectin type III domain-containing protein n=1 Tax=Candidatus Poriferisodalis sp. TaxID=3101277 RepID=UPI003B59EA6C